MKKILFLSFVLATAFNLVQAQTARIGFTGGAVFASQKWEESNVSITSDARVGFTLGVLGDVALSDKFSFQPGLNFTQMGGKFKDIDFGFGGSDEVDIILNYLELPLNVLFKADAGGGKVFLGAGPSLGFGLSGKTKVGSESEDVNFGSDEDNDDYKPFDFGGNVLAGYELSNGLSFSVNYRATLNNISPYSEGTIRNRYFGIRIGYLLGAAKK